MISCPVNIQANPTLGVLSHQAIQPPMPAPVINVSVEMLTFQFWIYGYATNKNKFAKKTVHKGQWICQGGHDCGMLIPDVTMPLVGNLLYLLHWPFSKGAMTFAASTVKMDGQPTACAAIVPPFPMMTCGQPVGAPTRFSYIANLNNVYVGMTFMDILAGVVAIALSIVIDLIFNKLGGSGAADDAAASTTRSILRDQVGKGLLSKLGPMELAKSAVNGLAGLVTSGMQGDPTYKVGFGISPIVGGEFTLFARDGSTGQTTGPVLQGQALGWQGDTAGNRASWGTSTPAPSGDGGSGGSGGGSQVGGGDSGSGAQIGGGDQGGSS